MRRFMGLVRQGKDREAYALTDPYWFAEGYPDFAAFEKLADMLRKEALPCLADNAVDSATPSGGHLAKGPKDAAATQLFLRSTCPPEPGRRPKMLFFVFPGELRQWHSPPDGIGSIAWY